MDSIEPESELITREDNEVTDGRKLDMNEWFENDERDRDEEGEWEAAEHSEIFEGGDREEAAGDEQQKSDASEYVRACHKLHVAPIHAIDRGLVTSSVTVKDACLKEHDLLALALSLKVDRRINQRGISLLEIMIWQQLCYNLYALGQPHGDVTLSRGQCVHKKRLPLFNFSIT